MGFAPKQNSPKGSGRNREINGVDGHLIERLEDRIMLDGTVYDLPPAGDTPGAGYEITAGQKTDLLTGMAALETKWATLSDMGDIGSETLDLLSGSALGDLLDIAADLDDGFLTPSQDYLNADGTPTLGEWSDYLVSVNAARVSASLDVSLSNINIPAFDPAASDIYIEFDYHSQLDISSTVLALSTYFTDMAFDELGFSLAVDNLSLDITGAIDFTVRLGTDDTNGFYIQPGDMDVAIDFDAGSPVDITAGMFNLVTGTVTTSGLAYTLSLSDPGTTADSASKICTAEINATALNVLADSTLDSTTARINVPLVANDGGLTFDENAALAFEAADAAADATFEMVTSDLGSLVRTVNLSPQALAQGFYHLAQSFQGMDNLSLIETELAFTDGATVGDIIDFGQAVSDGFLGDLYTLVDDVPVEQFNTWSELLTAMTGYYSTVTFDSNSLELLFTIDFDYEFDAVNVDLDFDVDLGALDVATSAQGSLDGTAGFTFTLGVSLAPDQQLLVPAGQEEVDTETGAQDGKLGSSASFDVILNQFTEYTIDVAKADTDDNSSLFDLVDDINDAIAAEGADGDIEAVLIDYQTFGRIVTRADVGVDGYTGTGRIAFQTVDSDEWALRVEVAGGNSAYTELGFETSAGEVPSLADIFIEDTQVETAITLDATAFTASADLGMVSMSITDADLAFTGSASANIVDADTSAARITVLDLFTDANRWDDMADLSLSGTGSITLGGVSVSDVSGLSLGADPRVEIAVNDITDDSDITVSYEDFGNLLSTNSMSSAQILAALADAADYLEALEDLTFLDFSIPVVNSSTASVLSLSSDFESKIQQVSASVGSASSLQILTADLTDAFNLGGLGSFAMSMNGTDLKMDVQYSLSSGDDSTFSLELAALLALVSGDSSGFDMISSIFDANGTADVSVDAQATVSMSVGLDLSDPANPESFLYDSSEIDISLSVTGQNLQFEFSVGPQGMFVKQGSVAIDADGNISTNDSVTIGVTMVDGDSNGRHYFDDGAEPIADDLNCTMSGAMGISLPIFYPTDSIAFDSSGTNVYEIAIDDLRDLANSTAGSVDITAPDFSGIFSDVNITETSKNPALIIDGLQGMIDMVYSSLSAVFTATSLPLVGDSLVDAASFITDMGSSLLEDVRTSMNLVFDGFDPIDLIQQAMFSAFGPSGLDILQDSTGDSQVTIDDVELTIDPEWQFVEYDMDLGQTFWAESCEFDIGIDNFPLGLDGEVQVAIGWEWDFAFGIDAFEGFYIVDKGDYDENGEIDNTDSELKFGINVTMPQTLTGELFILEAEVNPLDEDGNVDYSRSLLGGNFYINYADPDQEGMISLSDIRANEISDLLTAGFIGGLDADLEIVLSLGGSTLFPRIRTETELIWTYDKPFGQESVTTDPTITLSVQLDLGSFMNSFLKPVMLKIDEIVDPIRPVLDFLTDDLPIINMSPAEIATAFGYGSYASFIEAVDWVADMAADAAALPDDLMWLYMGSFTVAGEDGDISPQNEEEFGEMLAASAASPAAKDFMSEADDNAGFQLNILQPLNIFKLIMGQDVPLITYTIPPLELDAGYSQFFSVFGPLGMRIGGDLKASLNLAFGYDTYGLRRAMDTGNYAYVMDGFYISDRENADGTGEDIPEAAFSLDLYAGAELNAVVARGGVKGGIIGGMDFNLNDPNNDGKIRLKELVGNMLEGIEYVFDVSAYINAYVSWYVKIGVGWFSISKSGTIVDTTLYEESWSAASDPVLITEGAPGELTLNMGDFAEDRLHGDKSTGSESFVLSPSGGDLLVSYGGESQTVSYSPGDTILINAGPGDDSVIINSGLDVNVEFYGGSGNDYIEMHGSGNLYADGGSGNDTIIVTSGTNTLIGGDGNDNITGGSGADRIEGGIGNDTLNGGAGDDTYIFGPGFGSDTITDSSGNDTADFSVCANPLSFDTAAYRVDSDLTSDTVTMAAYLETIKGSSASDTILSRDEVNTWQITGANQGDYNSYFDFQSFERLIGNSQDDLFIFSDGAYISDYLDGGSGIEDLPDASYTDMTQADVLDLSAYSTSNRWQVSDIDQGRLFMAMASPEFTNIESHYGGSARDYLVMSNDYYITGIFDGNGGEDRVELSDYHLVDSYKQNTWDFTGVNSGSVNEKTAFQNCENFTGGENEDTYYFYPAGTYAEGFLYTPGGNGGGVNGYIDALGETDTISHSPTFRISNMLLAQLAPAGDMNPAAEGVEEANFDVVWHITGQNSGTRTADGTTTTFTSTQNLVGASGSDLFVIHVGGSLDGYIDGTGGSDAIVYGWTDQDWTSQVDISFTTTTQASATAIGGYVANVERYVSGTNTSDTFTGANVANVWDITDDDSGNISGAVPVQFSNFENITGGTGADTFSFADGATLTGSVSGGSGTDLIDMSAYSAAIAWAISSNNAGTITLSGGNPISFSAIESVTGSTGVDTFTFANGTNFTVSIDGSSGADVLDYQAWTAGQVINIDVTNGGTINRSGGLTSFDNIENINTGSGNDSLIFAHAAGVDGTINAGGGTDSFDYSDYNVSTSVSVDLEQLTATGVATFASVETFIGGQSLDNTLTGQDGVTSQWSITGIDDGQISVTESGDIFTFYDFAGLTGGSGADSFVFTDTKYVHGPITGSGGSDTLDFTGYSYLQSWTISGSGIGQLEMTETLDPLTLEFTAIETINSGDAADNFTFTEDGYLVNLHTGGDTDSVDFSARTSVLEINLETMNMTAINLFSGVDVLIGSQNNDMLTGANQENTWLVSSANAGSINASTAGALAFSSIENLTGGSDDDTFAFADAATISGNVDAAGEGAAGNTLDYSDYTTAVTVDLQNTQATGIGGTFSSVRNFVGGDAVDTLIAKDSQSNTWNLSNPDAGQINSGESVFDSFGHLTGGSGDDDFVFGASGSVSGLIDGDDGENTLDFSAHAAVELDLQAATVTDTDGFSNIDILIGSAASTDKLIGANTTNIWSITSANAGSVTGGLVFSDIENLTGGTDADTFTFSDGASVDGEIDGAAGSDHLNYALYTTAVSVDRQNSTATATGGIASIEQITGSAAATDSLTGLNSEAQWTLSTANAGSVSDGLVFASFENLTGGSAADCFCIGAAFSLAGQISGGDGSDTLDYSSYGSAITVDIELSNITAITGGFAAIENIIGSAQLSDNVSGFAADSTYTVTGSAAGQFSVGTYSFSGVEILFAPGNNDTISGSTADMQWDISSNNGATLDSVFAFTGGENFTGGSGADSFVLSSGVSVTGIINGADGSDSLDYSDFNTDIAINLDSMTATNIGGWLSIEDFTAGSGDNIITGANDPNTWLISEDNGGSVDGNIAFHNFGYLVGGTSVDTFEFADGVILDTGLSGAAGADYLNFTNYTSYNTWTDTPTSAISINTQRGSFTMENVETYASFTSVFLFSNYDLAGGFGSVDLPVAIAPGESFKIEVEVTNYGNAMFNDRIAIDVYASTDQSLDTATDILIGQLTNQMVSLRQSRSDQYTMTIEFPDDMDFGDYYLIVQVDPADEIDEVDEDNNIDVADDTATIAAVFGNPPGRRSVPLALETDGKQVNITINGPGWGVLPNGDLSEIELYDTTRATTLKLDVEDLPGFDDLPGNIEFGDITAGGDLGSILADEMDLTGDITIGGTLNRLVLANISAGQTSVVTIGADIDPTDNAMLDITADNIYDLQLDSSVGIKRLIASRWINTDLENDTLDATSIQTIDINGAVDASIVSESNLNLLNVDGELSGEIFVAENINRVVLDSDFTGMINSGGSIGEFTIADSSLSGTVITGEDLRNLKVNNGVLDGVINVGAALQNLNAKDSQVSGFVQVGLLLGSMTAQQLSGSVFCSGTINNIAIRGGNLSGQIFAFDLIKNALVAGGALTGHIGSNGSINNVSVRVRTGSAFAGASDEPGDFTGSIDAGDAIGRVFIENQASGDINAAIVNDLIFKQDYSGDIVVSGEVDEFPQLARRPHIRKIMVKLGDFRGSIEAGSIGLMNVKGEFNGEADIDGDFGELIVISDFVDSATVDVGGDFNNLKVHGSYAGKVTSGGDMKNVVIKQSMLDASGISAAGEIKTTLIKGGITAAAATAQIYASSFVSLTVAGDVTNARILAGGNLGSDWSFGGIADAADSYAAGYIKRLTIKGAVADSIIAAGATGDAGGIDIQANADNDTYIVGSYIKHMFIRGEITSSVLPAMTYGVGTYDFIKPYKVNRLRTNNLCISEI